MGALAGYFSESTHYWLVGTHLSAMAESLVSTQLSALQSVVWESKRRAVQADNI